jgi:hypothetical protein
VNGPDKQGLIQYNYNLLQKKLYHLPSVLLLQNHSKKRALNGKITSHDKETEYYMIEYKDGDSEELRHKTFERYIITADTG